MCVRGYPKRTANARWHSVLVFPSTGKRNSRAGESFRVRYLLPLQACSRLNHCTLYKVMTVLARDFASCVYALDDVASVYCRSRKAKRGHISKTGARMYSDGGVGGGVGTSKGHDLVTK
ncbi:hypothetical protein QBC45DRAFT_139604 [Copromyces sp. CBS 386.78]|nr:hypothetical protein QBC45DRAFT_139604 [Copromyces sp. CBS 386.78]